MAKGDEVILIGWGKTSIASDVKKHLENEFGFKVILPVNLPELRASFLDNETRFSRPVSELILDTYKNKAVYIVQDTRIYDHRLMNVSEEIEKLANRLDNPELIDLSKRLTYLTKPLFHQGKGISALFASQEHHPDRLIRKIHGMIDFLKDAQAKHVGLVFRKSSYEWSHHHYKAREQHGLWEMFTLKQIIREFALHGANSIIYLHPHAPTEGLMFARDNNMNYVSINHQGNSLNNGEEIDLLNLFNIPENSQKKEMIYPFDAYLKSRQNKTEPEYAPQFTFIVSPDEGALKATTHFAQRNHLPCISSKKNRKDEGQSSITESDEITPYLEKAKKIDPNATLTFIILDDKLNTASTANNEAQHRAQQVKDFNQLHNTKFKVKVELWVSHFRNPYLFNLNHHNLSKIVILDTVPFFPHLEEQLTEHNIRQKFRILPASAFQLAAGIALDYKLNVQK